MPKQKKPAATGTDAPPTVNTNGKRTQEHRDATPVDVTTEDKKLTPMEKAAGSGNQKKQEGKQTHEQRSAALVHIVAQDRTLVPAEKNSGSDSRDEKGGLKPTAGTNPGVMGDKQPNAGHKENQSLASGTITKTIASNTVGTIATGGVQDKATIGTEPLTTCIITKNMRQVFNLMKKKKGNTGHVPIVTHDGPNFAHFIKVQPTVMFPDGTSHTGFETSISGYVMYVDGKAEQLTFSPFFDRESYEPNKTYVDALGCIRYVYKLATDGMYAFRENTKYKISLMAYTITDCPDTTEITDEYILSTFKDIFLPQFRILYPTVSALTTPQLDPGEAIRTVGSWSDILTTDDCHAFINSYIYPIKKHGVTVENWLKSEKGILYSFWEPGTITADIAAKYVLLKEHLHPSDHHVAIDY